VLAGLLLSGRNISKVICVLDGDVHRTVQEKLKIIQKCLTGKDRVVKQQRREVLGRFFEFTLQTTHQKGAPEFNHKCWFEAIDPARISEDEAAEYDKLRLFSTSINGLADWHGYWLNESPGTEIQHRTYHSELYQQIPAWENYISAVRQEITERAAELE
jgi:hypothetical protein